jgi:hypothetical protein
MSEATEPQTSIQFPHGKLACSIEEFAEFSNSSRSSVYAAIAAGELIARKMGARTIILAAEGLQYLNNLPAAKSRAA